ncbi:MAG TPA: class III lanthionine synthetase LanKC [Streptosporangiaceae bacterium]|nr:class III lanthionine synthetase LanKC [Streptosporangiaceae bacterium]
MEDYEIYCLADPFFYDTLDHRPADAPDFPLACGPVPDGWVRHASDTWMYYGPADAAPLPAQGWKIHVSARADDAERTLTAVWDYCVPRKITFKFLRSSPVHVMRNSKAASRSGSGKLVTIYPRDEAQLELTLKELNELLHGVVGAYILSDLRYAEGPLFVRYGGFWERKCLSETGERVLAIEDAEGRLVPDVRGATFSVPPWVTLPEFLEPYLAARNAVTTTELAYEIEDALHFSNGGGVYLGRAKAGGERVVLKEARPHAGVDAAGRDAVARLQHERDILERLAGLDVVPALHDYFTLGEHHFLVQEFVDSNALQRLLVQRYPLTRADCSAETLAEYTRWVLDILPRVERAVDALHERGVVFGDLHPNNILVTGDDRLVLIDFEVATLAADESRAALAHPAFGAPRDRVGVATDRYALACLCLGLFAPQLTMTLPMHRAKVIQLGEIVTETFPVPRELITDAVRTIIGEVSEADAAGQPEAPPPAPGQDDWPTVKAALHRAILASATPERDDRLFPGDIAQFRPGGGLTLAHGAAGVLYALAETGAGRFPDHEDWLRKRALAPDPRSGLGFYDGMHGVAYLLDRLGHRQDALDIVEMCLREQPDQLGLSLFSGLAGIGLNLLHLSETTGEPGLREAADQALDRCADRLGGPDDVPEISGGANPLAGLMRGSAGVALFFLHAYERTGDTALLDKAADALRQDLRRCFEAEDGSLQVNQGWRYLPYLDEGSIGIGLVLARYLAHRGDETFARALSGIRLVAKCRYFVQSGLLAGRGGIIAALGMGLRPGLADRDPLLTDQIRGLRWHALPYGGGLAFPGDMLFRLSMDLATGTAGVLFALSTALDAQRTYLPFIGPPGGTGAMTAASPAHGFVERLGSERPRKEV